MRLYSVEVLIRAKQQIVVAAEDEDFAMDWELYRDKQKRFKEISDAAKGADRLVLATDPDREGEAISWHVRELLKKRKVLPTKVDRVTFNAITKSSIIPLVCNGVGVILSRSVPTSTVG